MTDVRGHDKVADRLRPAMRPRTVAVALLMLMLIWGPIFLFIALKFFGLL